MSNFRLSSFTLLLVSAPVHLLAQNPGQEQEIHDIMAVEEMPEFPGGQEAMYKFMASTMHYPDSALERGIQGKVYVEFVVERDGQVTDVKTRRGVDPYLDEEAVRLIKAMPRWNPGKSNGKPVRVMFTMPIAFTLR